MDEGIVPPVSSSPEALSNGDYFTLLEMFTWTRWLHICGAIFFKPNKIQFSDIAVSVSESAVLAREFLVSLLAEFYLQLTTISWLSVRTVQRSSNPSLTASDDDNRAGSLLSSILSAFSSLLEFFSGSGAAQEDSGWSSAPEPSVVMITKAEERVRWGEMSFWLGINKYFS